MSKTPWHRSSGVTCQKAGKGLTSLHQTMIYALSGSFVLLKYSICLCKLAQDSITGLEVTEDNTKGIVTDTRNIFFKFQT